MNKKSTNIEADDYSDDWSDEEYAPVRTGRYSSGNETSAYRSSFRDSYDGTNPPIVLANDRGVANGYLRGNRMQADDPDEPEEEEIKDHRGLKALAVILFAGFLLGMFIPLYFEIPFSFCVGNPFYEGSVPILFSLIEALGGGISFNGPFVSVLWLTFFLIVTLILMIIVLASRKNVRTAFCLESASVIAGALIYLQFCYAHKAFVIDLIVVVAVVAIVAFIIESLAIGGTKGALNLLGLIGLALMVLGFALSGNLIGIVKSVLSILKGQEITTDYVMLLVAIVLLVINAILTIIQLSCGMATTWFTFARYALQTIVSFVALGVTVSVREESSIYAELGLCLCGVIALVLTVIALFACLVKARNRNKKQAAVANAPHGDRARAVAAGAPAQQPEGGVVADTAAQPAANAGMPNIYINFNQGTGDQNGSPVVQIYGNGQTPQSAQCGICGGVCTPEEEPEEESAPAKKSKNTLLGSFMLALGVVAGIAGLFFLIYNSAVYPAANALGGFLTFLCVVACLGAVGSVIAAFVLRCKRLVQIGLICSVATFLLELLYQFSANGGFSSSDSGEFVGKIVVLCCVILAVVFIVIGYVNFQDKKEEEEEELAAERAVTLGRYRLMGESFANEQCTRQPDLEAQSAPIIDLLEEEVAVSEPEVETMEEVAVEATESEAEATEEVAEEATEPEAEATEEVAVAEAEMVEEEPVEELVEEIEDDGLMQSLTPAMRAEFRKVFLGENAPDFLPAYQVGEDNTEFFNEVFIHLTRIRSYVSDELLTALYKFINP